MGDVTQEDVARDSIRTPGQLSGEGGVVVGNSETAQRQRDGGAVFENPIVAHPGVAGMMGGEFMQPEQRIDGDQAEEALREEDVTLGDRLSDDVRESDVGAGGLPGGAQGEDMLPEQRIDGGDE